MQIDRTKLLVADSILPIVEKMFLGFDDVGGDVYVCLGAYQNCREQGYSLFLTYRLPGGDYKRKFVCFSENRNSDEIVVYTNDIDPDQGINERMYKNAKFFPWNQERNAAQYIFDELTSIVTN